MCSAGINLVRGEIARGGEILILSRWNYGRLAYRAEIPIISSSPCDPTPSSNYSPVYQSVSMSQLLRFLRNTLHGPGILTQRTSIRLNDNYPFSFIRMIGTVVERGLLSICGRHALPCLNTIHPSQSSKFSPSRHST